MFCFRISSPTSLATGKQWSVQLPLILPGSLQLHASGPGDGMDTESERRGYLIWDQAMLFQISLLVTERVELTDSISEIKETSIWCTMLSSSIFDLLYCALKPSYSLQPATRSLPSIAIASHTTIQCNTTTRSWKHHTYHTPSPSGWSSLWLQDWHWVAH